MRGVGRWSASVGGGDAADYTVLIWIFHCHYPTYDININVSTIISVALRLLGVSYAIGSNVTCLWGIKDKDIRPYVEKYQSRIKLFYLFDAAVTKKSFSWFFFCSSAVSCRRRFRCCRLNELCACVKLPSISTIISSHDFQNKNTTGLSSVLQMRHLFPVYSVGNKDLRSLNGAIASYCYKLAQHPVALIDCCRSIAFPVTPQERNHKY